MMMVEQSHTTKTIAPIVIAYVARCKLCGELHISSFTSIPRFDKSDTISLISDIVPDILMPISIPCWIAKLLKDRRYRL